MACAGCVGCPVGSPTLLPSSTTGFNLLDLTCLIGAVTACHHLPGSRINRCRFTGLRCSCPGQWASRALGGGSITHGCCLWHVPWHHWYVMGTMGHKPCSCAGHVAMLLQGACQGVCQWCPPSPCVTAAYTVPLQIPKCWLPRYIRRSHVQHPRRPLSLRFNGKLWLRGLKLGIKAAVARLLATGDAHERVRGVGGWSQARQCCQGCARSDPPSSVCVYAHICVHSCVWMSWGGGRCTCLCVQVCLCVCRCIYMCVWICMHKWLWCKYMHVRTCRLGGCIPACVHAHLRVCMHASAMGVHAWRSPRAAGGQGFQPQVAPVGGLVLPAAPACSSSNLSLGTRSGARLALFPDISSASAGCMLRGAAAAPVSPGRSTSRAWGTQGQVWGCSSGASAPVWPHGAGSQCFGVA